MSIFDPRPDTRSPTFAKGQWFGGVPHTRIIVFAPQATGVLEPWRGGLVMDLQAISGTDPNDLQVRYQGFSPSTGQAAFYLWDVTDIGSGEAVCQLLLGSTLTTPQSSATGFRTFQPLRPAENIPFVWNTVGLDPRWGATGLKVDVPEWSNVLDYWPNASGAIEN